MPIDPIMDQFYMLIHTNRGMGENNQINNVGQIAANYFDYFTEGVVLNNSTTISSASDFALNKNPEYLNGSDSILSKLVNLSVAIFGEDVAEQAKQETAESFEEIDSGSGYPPEMDGPKELDALLAALAEESSDNSDDYNY